MEMQNGEESTSSDSDLEVQGRSQRRSRGAMSDLEFIRDNVIDTLKQKLELIPSPKKLNPAKTDDGDSSEDDDRPDGDMLDREKEDAELQQMLASKHDDEPNDSEQDDADEDLGSVDEDDGDGASSVVPPRTKNEISLEEPVQVLVESEEDLNLLGSLEDMNSDKCVLEGGLLHSLIAVGEVLYALPDTFTVVVQGGGEGVNIESNILNEGSILFREDGVVLGRVHEVFGPVTLPFYLVRLDIVPRLKGTEDAPSTEGKDKKQTDLNKKGKKGQKNADVNRVRVTEKAVNGYLAKMEAFPKGTRIYCQPEHTSTAFVSASMLKQIKLDSGKGCDASNIYDEEVPAEEQDFSDDEVEAATRSKHRKKRSGTGNKAPGNRGAGTPGHRQNAPQPKEEHQSATTIHYYQPPPPMQAPRPPPPPAPAPAHGMYNPGLTQPHQAGAHVHTQLGGLYTAAPGYPQYQQYAYPPTPHAQYQPRGPPLMPMGSQQPWPGFQPWGAPPAPAPPPQAHAQAQSQAQAAPNLTMSFFPGPATAPRPPPQYQVKPLTFPGAHPPPSK